jgi:predicted transposase YdaD
VSYACKPRFIAELAFVMKTDHPIYLFLSTGPEAFRVLSGGQELLGDYRFSSLTLKGVERRIDGILEPEGHDGPVYIVEFQGQLAPAAWYNLLAKIGLYGEQHPQRDVTGLCVFLRASQAPAKPSWLGGVGSPVRGIGLDQFLPDWLVREPDNPYLAVFAPLLISDDQELATRARALWQTVQRAALEPGIRKTLSEILEYWFFERFRALSAKEIWAMLNMLTPLEETKAYQSIFAEGKAEGEAEGEAKGKVLTLKRLLKRRFATLPEWAEQRIDAAPEAQVDAWLDAIFDAISIEGLLSTAPGEA